MLTVAYLANEFPSAVEPYVIEEIEELRGRGVRVVTGSIRRSRVESFAVGEKNADITLRDSSLRQLVRAAWLCVCQWMCILPLLQRILLGGKENPFQRLKAMVHTFLGAVYAVRLTGRGVRHIHVHHGYFGSWVGMTAARLLGVGFSFTLHGSDLLLHGSYLDTKLAACTFCMTVSEYNRQYLLAHYPGIDEQKVIVARMGVDIPPKASAQNSNVAHRPIKILSVGRLHPVKDHAFLVRACAKLAARGLDFECRIVGDGPERRRLQGLIDEYGMADRIKLLGHVVRERIGALYNRADLVVLTSKSEGIPLVLMEAMARGKIVLAPSITGLPELVISGKTGFLYEPESIEDFVQSVLLIHSLLLAEVACAEDSFLRSDGRLDWIRHAARTHVQHSFNRDQNLKFFADCFLIWAVPRNEIASDENPVLQQI